MNIKLIFFSFLSFYAKCSFVKCLVLNFHIDLPSFEYFTNNCKANLNKWNILVSNNVIRKNYLRCVDNFQKTHDSLKSLCIFMLMSLNFIASHISFFYVVKSNNDLFK